MGMSMFFTEHIFIHNVPIDHLIGIILFYASLRLWGEVYSQKIGCIGIGSHETSTNKALTARYYLIANDLIRHHDRIAKGNSCY
jgi:hypothetical protein